MAKRPVLSLPCSSRPPRNSPPKYLLVTTPCLLVFSVIWSAFYFILSSLVAIVPFPSIKMELFGTAKDKNRTRPRPVQRPVGETSSAVVTALSLSLPAATLSTSLTTRSTTTTTTRRLGAHSLPTPSRPSKKRARLIGSFEPHSLDDVLESDEDEHDALVEDIGNLRTGPTRQSSGDDYLSDLGSPGRLTPDHGSEESEHSEAETLVDVAEGPNGYSVTHSCKLNKGSGFLKTCPTREARRAKKAAKARPTCSRSSSDSSTLASSKAATHDSVYDPVLKRSSSWLSVLKPFRSRSQSPRSSPRLSPTRSQRDASDVSSFEELSIDVASSEGTIESPTWSTDHSASPSASPSMSSRPVLDPSGRTRLVLEHLTL